MNNQDLLIRATKVDYPNVMKYLKSRRWSTEVSKRADVGIFRAENGGPQAIVPLDRNFSDYPEAILRVAAVIASVERRSRDQVISDLLWPSVDVLRFVRTNADDGTIGLEDSDLVGAARKAIRASACSVEHPLRRHHKRLASKVVDQFLSRCRLGQTERGSYVIKIFCPLRDDPRDETPFGRQSVEMLLKSSAALVGAIRGGTVTQILENAETEPTAAPFTANLCQALIDMMPSDESADIRLSASYSPLLASQSVTSVQIDRDLYESVEEVATLMRPLESTTADTFIGRVAELAGDDNDDGKLEGSVVFSLLVDDSVVRARATLAPTDYRRAVESHLNQQFISVQGALRRRARTAVLENVHALHAIVSDDSDDLDAPEV